MKGHSSKTFRVFFIFIGIWLHSSLNATDKDVIDESKPGIHTRASAVIDTTDKEDQACCFGFKNSAAKTLDTIASTQLLVGINTLEIMALALKNNPKITSNVKVKEALEGIEVSADLLKLSIKEYNKIKAMEEGDEKEKEILNIAEQLFSRINEIKENRLTKETLNLLDNINSVLLKIIDTQNKSERRKIILTHTYALYLDIKNMVSILTIEKSNITSSTSNASKKKEIKRTLNLIAEQTSFTEEALKNEFLPEKRQKMFISAAALMRDAPDEVIEIINKPSNSESELSTKLENFTLGSSAEKEKKKAEKLRKSNSWRIAHVSENSSIAKEKLKKRDSIKNFFAMKSPEGKSDKQKESRKKKNTTVVTTMPTLKKEDIAEANEKKNKLENSSSTQPAYQDSEEESE